MYVRKKITQADLSIATFSATAFVTFKTQRAAQVDAEELLYWFTAHPTFIDCLPNAPL